MKSTATEPVMEEVIVRTRIAAQRDVVWLFMSDPQRFAAWIGAFAGGPPQPGTEVEPRAGGRITVAYPHAGMARGQILEMQPPERIVFTWGYDDATHGINPGDTRVEITLEDMPEGTLVQLRHSGIVAEGARRDHRAGWIHYLSMLARLALETQHAETLPRVVEAYFRAWAEADAEARRALLAEACEQGVAVRSSFAHTDGIEELAEHIENAQRHMPGVIMEAAGAPQHVRGHARVDWVVKAPDGKEIFRGTNVMVLSAQSKLTSVVSFTAPR